MCETVFMGKSIDYWIDLDSKFGEVKDHPHMLLVAAEARLDILDKKYEHQKKQIKQRIEELRKQLGVEDGK
jgi:hypothetical protein